MPKNPTSLSRPGFAAAPARTTRVMPYGGAAGGSGRTEVSDGADGDGYRRAVEDRLDASTSAQELCRKAQFVDYESMRAMFEAWNTRVWRGAGTLASAMPHPALHTAVWPVGRHGLDASGGYYGARKGSEAVHVQADPADGTVLAANHTAAAIGGATVTAQLYNLGGRPIGARSERTVDLAAGRVTEALTVPFVRSLPATHLLRLRLTGADGRLLSANDYVRCRTPTDMRSVNGLPNVRLAVAARPAARTSVTATVANTGASPAAMVRLSLSAAPGGPDLPALADDNCLWLLPGESRDVTLWWPAGSRAQGAPAVVARAYNALPVTGRPTA
ncbi:hypothetical protein [Streptomyces sp. IBSBF 2435]|uniref:hypothetical protein n=1 Tax=Streptomyces sp. IBSBF 2435 TaxID=2903531 RepID=UPI002FDBD219